MRRSAFGTVRRFYSTPTAAGDSAREGGNASAALWKSAAPQYLDFSRPQNFASRAVGVLRGPVDAPTDVSPRSQSTTEITRYGELLKLTMLPPELVSTGDVDGAVPAGAGMQRYEASVRTVELAMETRALGEGPHTALLRLLSSDPNFFLSSDAAAVVIRELDRQAEEESRSDSPPLVPLWGRVVYPLYCSMTYSLRKGHGTPLLRSLEMYLQRAAARGELSINYAGYMSQRLKHTAYQWYQTRRIESLFVTGDLHSCVEAFAKDDELDLRLFTVLAHHIEGFQDAFPRQKPVGPSALVTELATYEAIYVLHASYIAEDPDGLNTLLDIVLGDEGDDLLLVPHWTLLQLLESSLDAPERHALAFKRLLEAMSDTKNPRVRFVWASETIAPLAHSRKWNILPESKDDRVIAFASWLRGKLPASSPELEAEAEEEVEAAEVELAAAEQYGKKKSDQQRAMLGRGGKSMPRKILLYTDVAREPTPKQGIIILTRDQQVAAHASALGLWAEPSGQTLRSASEFRKLRKTKWYQFLDDRPLSSASPPRKARKPRRRIVAKPGRLLRPGEKPRQPKRGRGEPNFHPSVRRIISEVPRELARRKRTEVPFKRRRRGGKAGKAAKEKPRDAGKSGAGARVDEAV
eukprot:Hpha_TRINITY_DN27416_c0_g1::TRINITY_DN27416_c0_g1_i1::g.193938::m.193938